MPRCLPHGADGRVGNPGFFGCRRRPPGRDFRLRDANGRERTLADFKGQALMVFFGFTQCPDVCPTALTRALEIRELLGADGARLAVAFITIDPERDTAQVLKAYVGAFDPGFVRSEEHTSELQSPCNLVCRLLLEK